jgi:glycosyltransferase involved in cell wall biosynthesis
VRSSRRRRRQHSGTRTRAAGAAAAPRTAGLGPRGRRRGLDALHGVLAGFTTEVKNGLAKIRNDFAYDDLDQVYSSADIGLAFYNTEILGTNCQTIGLSSGKIARYLFHGIPVIINNETSLVNLINEYQCGVIINHWDELNNACNLIKDNYLDYSKNACNCFNQVLAVEKHFEILWSEVFK